MLTVLPALLAAACGGAPDHPEVAAAAIVPAAQAVEDAAPLDRGLLLPDYEFS